eukprot:NODE_491_length_7770_cov_0.866771.p7 type:complete len:115 gc:universal NODE_491_length_7770_cov_0.866771:815-471(-)
MQQSRRLHMMRNRSQSCFYRCMNRKLPESILSYSKSTLLNLLSLILNFSRSRFYDMHCCSQILRYLMRHFESESSSTLHCPGHTLFGPQLPQNSKRRIGSLSTPPDQSWSYRFP